MGVIAGDVLVGCFLTDGNQQNTVYRTLYKYHIMSIFMVLVIETIIYIYIRKVGTLIWHTFLYCVKHMNNLLHDKDFGFFYLWPLQCHRLARKYDKIEC